MKKVLIADDDRIILALLEKGFKKYADQFEIIMVPDGQEAIAVLDQEPIDLVVTDIQMPRLDGVMLLAYIHTYHPRTPCIVMTSHGSEHLKAKLPRELIRFVQKPFKVDHMARAVMAALQREKPHETAEGLSVVSFLKMIEVEQISCILEIDSPGQPKGRLYFQKGVLLDARCGDLGGEPAALELIAREMSRYRFQDLDENQASRRIQTPLGELIRNAVLDEPETEIFLD